MITFRNLIYLIIIVLINGCVSPVNLTFDRASTLGKNNIEINGSVSHYNKVQDQQIYGKNENYGGRIGFGLSDKTDLKIRYERLIDISTTDHKGYNYISIFPKFSIVKDKLAVLVPFSSYFSTAIFDSDSRYTIAP